jgi:hypothetical protein
MKNLELLAEVVNDLKNHHLVGLEARHFKITSLRSLFPGRNAMFDWIPIFFSGTNNKNWLENVGKITMIGKGVKREILISNKKENAEKKIAVCTSKITIPSYSKKNPEIKGLKTVFAEVTYL